jgi:murein tripeptide amidase MpaA
MSNLFEVFKSEMDSKYDELEKDYITKKQTLKKEYGIANTDIHNEKYTEFIQKNSELTNEYCRSVSVLNNTNVNCSCNKIIRFRNIEKHLKEPMSHTNCVLGLNLRGIVIEPTLIVYI